MSIFCTNNYTKLISQKILNEINKWHEILDNKKDLDTELIINKYKAYVSNYLNIAKYDIFILNGNRSHNIVFKMACALDSKSIIHIIISNTEEAGILSYCKQLINTKLLEITILTPNKYGIIDINDINKNIKKNTKMIIMPYINKDLGTVNNIKEIYNICKPKDILLSSNINYLFGYSDNYKILNNIDISFVSFDTIYGPSNLSLLIVRKKLINADIYNVIKSSSYSINEKKNIPLISGSLCSIVSIAKNRNEKNEKIQKLKNIFIDKLAEIIPIYKYTEYKNIYSESIIKLSIIIMNEDFINKSNTILLSVFSNKIKINNNNIKKTLEKNNIIINDISTNFINDSVYGGRIRNGLLSISIGDHNKQSDINILLKSLLESIKHQYINLYDEIRDNIIVKRKLSQKKSKKIVRFNNPLCIGANSKKHNYPKLKSILAVV